MSTEDKAKVCPLMADSPLGAKPDCMRDGCAWWDGKSCAVLTLAASLDWLNNNGIVTYPEK